MSQNDFVLANQDFPSMRTDMNSALQALASNSSGATAPSTTYAYQWWYDTSVNILKMRNSDNDGWISIAVFDQTNDKWLIVEKTSLTGSAALPSGTTAQRDGSPATGYLRFNTTDGKFEGYDGTEWGTVGGGGGGLFKGENGTVGDETTGPGDIFRINEQTLNTNVTIDADENASATGPLAIASGVTLTVTSGGSLAII
jgi:hypothetical protein